MRPTGFSPKMRPISFAGRDSQSMAFFRTPGIELLYSGVTIRRLSALATPLLQRGDDRGRGFRCQRALRARLATPRRSRASVLLEKTWDTSDDDEAIAAWERAWDGAAIERCDWPNELALRVRRGHGLRSKWARAHRDASGAVSMRDATDAEDCAALRATAPAQ